MARTVLHFLVTWLLFLAALSHAFVVPVEDTDYSRQVCSGMWGGFNTFINVTFESQSQGQLAMVIYEWSDAPYLGKATDTSSESEYLPKTYVCTSSAVLGGYCSRAELGRFILDLPEGKTINDTSFWSARVALSNVDGDASEGSTELSTGDFWDNPAGNPTPSTSEYDSPWRRRKIEQRSDNLSPEGIYEYHEPIQYTVRKTGYYCVAIVPVTVQPTSASSRAPTDVPFHPEYKGTVLFQNTFHGQLPATDYPKVNFYLAMFLLYAIFGAIWGWLCYKHVHELLPIQYYLSGLVALLVIEMMASWGYYRYLNAHGRSTASIAFLIVVAILDAGRNSMSFFMLLVVSMGLSVVRESLGRTMIKCQILAGLHFIFGIIYAVGIVELELESTSALILLLFVVPLAFTLSGFLLWIMYSLNATISQLRARKQRYKLGMFERLYYILLFVVVVIGIFFVVSSMSFSGRLAEDYAAKTWRVRWWLLDGWLALLYFVAFSAIAFLWRPSENNRRLVLSDELAQDEADAEDYDLESLEHSSRVRDDDDNATLVAGRTLASDHVVFEIGDEDGGSDDEDTPAKRKSTGRGSSENHHSEREEREALMTRDAARSRDD